MVDHCVSESKLLELSLPPAFGNTDRSASGSDLGVKSVLQIDRSLLIDPRRLSIGPVISEGLNSVVYEGSYGSEPVAVKVILPNKSLMMSYEEREKFEREVTVLSRVKHDNILKFIGATVEPTPMIITELMRGGTLQKYLWSIRPNCPDLKLSITFALKVSQAMEYLHGSGIIHRDLKPSNLLLSESKRRIKVADFGLAREKTMGKMSTEAGTYRWMAPEMFSVEPLKVGVKKHYNHKVDVYSFSMVLWELLTNSTPFKGRNGIMVAYAASSNIRPSVDDIPKDIAPLLQSCWAEDPADRPEFIEITEFLGSKLCNLCLTQNTPPKLVGIESPTAKMTEESSLRNRVMDESEEKNKNTTSPCRRFLSCFDHCL